MKAISLWQPWASAIANGVKQIETRHWRTNYSGQLAIHAAQKRTGEMAAIFDGLLHDHALILQAFVRCREDGFRTLPFGAVVAVATLQECVRSDMLDNDRLSPVERALGNYGPGRYGWILRDVKKLTKAVPCGGRQQLFILPADVEAKVREQL